MSRDWRERGPSSATDANDAAVAPGKTPRTSQLSGRLYRKEAGDDMLGAARAQQVLSTTASASTGQPMDGGLRRSMESSFDRSFGNVRIHTDAPAVQAAADLNANAFTVGSNVFFGAGQYSPGSESGQRLIGHELAHVAQGDGVAPAGSAGATVSSPGDASERAADSAGDAVASGQKVQKLGSSSPGVVHRDAMSDLDENSKRTNVDEKGALSTIRGMSDGERAKVTANKALMKRLCAAFDQNEMITLFTLVFLDLRWKIYWLDEAIDLGKVTPGNWAWLLGYTPPAQWAELRKYDWGFKQVMAHAPDKYLPAWDKLQGLVDGSWKGNAQKIRNATTQLNTEQKKKVAADNPKMEIIMEKCGNAKEKIRTVLYLDPPLKWKVYYLLAHGALDDLTQNQWSQVMLEATKSEVDELKAYEAGWTATQKNCPEKILKITTGMADEKIATKMYDDPSTVDAMAIGLGPEGFLAASTKGTTADVYKNYQASLKHISNILDGLPRGVRLGERTIVNLTKWWKFGRESRPSVAEKMLAVRFNVNTQATAERKEAHEDDTTRIAPWTIASLRRCWTVMERLPPAQVVGNDRLIWLLRNDKKSVGNAYFMENDVVMGMKDDSELTGNVGASEVIYGTGSRGHGGPAVSMNEFDAALRHEIGHAVDNQLGIMETWGAQDVAGGWIRYSSKRDFAKAIIEAGGMTSHGYPEVAKYKKAIYRAVNDELDFLVALFLEGGNMMNAVPFKDKGPIAAVWEKDRWLNSPWSKESWKPQGGRNFQRAYKNKYYSHLAEMQKNRTVTKYRWRAPGEWFAESYQVYYAEQQNSPDAPVGGILRGKDRDAANMLSSLVDRGHSPQDMRGGNTVKAPGT